MSKNVFCKLSMLIGVLFIIGCSSTKDVEVHRYVEIRDRVDQEMDKGNAGYLAGTPQPEDRSDIRKTRKIYVLEVSKDSETEDEAVMLEREDGQDNARAREDLQPSDQYLAPPKTSRLPQSMVPLRSEQNVMDDVQEGSTDSPPYVEYTVEKDDTMQKISKKFYDSYSKWPRIYDANREVIDNPDKIKPGTVIRIPTME